VFVKTVAELLALAGEHYQAGNFAQAEQLYHHVLQIDPSHADAWGYLGAVCQAQGKLHEAEIGFRRAAQGSPGNASAHNCLAVVLVQEGKLSEAAASLQEALRIQPNDAQVHNNLGAVLAHLGRAADAVASYRQALFLKPGDPLAHYNLGLALKVAGQHKDAIAELQEALRCQPDFADAMHDLGNIWTELKNFAEAQKWYRQALLLRPGRADFHHNLGNAMQNQGQHEEAIGCYRQALVLEPNFAHAHFNLGTALQRLGQQDQAAGCYREALRLLPNYAEAHNNLGLVLQELGRLEEAIACHRRAAELKPQSADVQANLGGALREQGKMVQAIACYRRALQLRPNNPAVLGELAHQLQHVCLWDGLQELSGQVVETVAVNPDSSAGDAVSPFIFLALPTLTTAAQQLQCARQWVNQQRFQPAAPGSPLKASARPRSPRSKIALGYLSADYHAHAIAYLIAEVIEQHDRNRFTVSGYSYGPDDGSPMRKRMVDAFDRFINVRESSSLQAAEQIGADEIDILIDLKGLTIYARPQILALRPAPIQVHFLGYPGTLGAPFVDYLLVDHFIVPPEQQPFFAENLVHLPGCYQANDSRREISPHTPSRAECGLPEKGFVFCCFNNSFKITPRVFAIWMELLRNVPRSVLWLFEDNPVAPANLRREAEIHGVAAERLVFAPRVALADHLARHRLAQLFLDTLPYNAHTTASDALWAGCPVLTVVGQTFVSRVAGSLLRTVGLPELVTRNFEDYRDLALRLARDAELLAGLKARLLANRKTSSLFNGREFARNLEKAYLKMWEIYASRQEPHPFAVTPNG
jgi:protein O-GlcNAc transferase